MEWFLELFPGQGISEKAQAAAAIGAWAAGAATFCAVLVALYLGRQSTKIRGRFTVRHCSSFHTPDGKILNLIEDRSPPEFTEPGLLFEITNTNIPILRIRNLRINSLFSRENLWLPGHETTPNYTNKAVEFGDSISFLLPTQYILGNEFFLEEYRSKTFKKQFYFCLDVGGGKKFKAFFPCKLNKELQAIITANNA